MKIFRNLFLFICLSSLLVSTILGPLPTLAQDSSITTSPTQLDTQSEKVTELRNRKTELTSEKAKLEREIATFEAQILDLEKERLTAAEEIELDQKKLIELSRLSDSTNQNTREDTDQERDVIAQRIQLNQTRLQEIDFEKTELESNIQLNQKTIETLNIEIGDLDQKLSEEINVLQSQVAILGINVSRYLILIIFYWVIHQIIKFITSKITSKESVRSLVSLITSLTAIVASVVTILIAFIGNLPFLLTSLGVVSAAMVVALQEFISSFFAWFVIRIRGPYKKGDLIQIQTNVEVYTGVVKSVGVFRTMLREKVGGATLDREQFTGKIVDFPNNMILRHPVKNFTHDDAILWHTMDVIVTYESDHKLAGKILEKVLHDYFVFALDHKDIYLDNVYNLNNLYKPRMYFSLAGDGPCYTLWFAARTGKLREVVENISSNLLDEFNVAGIDIAYKTSRVIPTQDFDKPSRFYLTGETDS